MSVSLIYLFLSFCCFFFFLFSLSLSLSKLLSLILPFHSQSVSVHLFSLPSWLERSNIFHTFCFYWMLCFFPSPVLKSVSLRNRFSFSSFYFFGLFFFLFTEIVWKCHNAIEDSGPWVQWPCQYFIIEIVKRKR